MPARPAALKPSVHRANPGWPGARKKDMGTLLYAVFGIVVGLQLTGFPDAIGWANTAYRQVTQYEFVSPVGYQRWLYPPARVYPHTVPHT